MTGLNCSMQDLSLWCTGFSLISDSLSCPVAYGTLLPRTHIPCVGRQILNHWTASEVPMLTDFYTLSQRWNNFAYISETLAKFSHNSNNSFLILTEFSTSMIANIKVFHSLIIIRLCSYPGQHNLVVEKSMGSGVSQSGPSTSICWPCDLCLT